MIKHVSTHWLSLENAGLKNYFLSSDDSNARFRCLKQQFEDPATDVHLSLYQAVLQQFVNVNKFMQLENPLISVLHDVLHDFLKKRVLPTPRCQENHRGRSRAA